jgi:SOS response regulatory protein OraA/RecX
MIPWNSEEWVGDCLIIKNNKNRMKDKIKENIEKEEIENKVISYINKNNQLDYSRVIKKTIKETSKAKDEEFLELLNKEQKDRINPNIIRAFCLKLKEKINGNQ